MAKHWTQTREGKAKLSAASKRSWRSGRRKRRVDARLPAPSPNGLSVALAPQIILQVKGTDVLLTMQEARALRDGLTTFLPKATSR